jgi:alpha-glucuronidase
LSKTAVMPELQITQEYLGFNHQLVYLGTMWEELLKSETYKKGLGSTVAKCTDGSMSGKDLTAIAGVSNIGLDNNWCGNYFAPSNWYAFGRLAWNNTLSSETIADEWLRQTFQYQQAQRLKNYTERLHYIRFVRTVTEMMIQSREAAVNYMMPLGLHHLFNPNEHYGSGPWYGPPRVRKDWTCVYYHKADSIGIGFDRTLSGSKAISQYNEPLSSQFNDVQTCPENLLLWFHHVPWKYRLKNGNNLWDELCIRYDKGVKSVRIFQKKWDVVEPYVDAERFSDVQNLLRRQVRDAQFWKDGCLLYFQQFSKMSFPYEIDPPAYDLNFLMKMNTLQPYKIEQ